MHFFQMELIRFLAMGGYARFIWPAYGIAFSVLFGNIYSAVKRTKKIKKYIVKKKE